MLADISGVTVLIHDQACAAELRRARSRGTVETPGFRVVINERVCEGCGDCGDKSNCLSVQPIDTPWGRKTQIHQSSCNFDLSCLQGDCPSFALVTVDNDEVRRQAKAAPVAPPDSIGEPRPPLVNPDEFVVRMTGIGGTGVVTVSQIVGTAAMLADRHVRGLDQTGLSQKAGPVVSDLVISADMVSTSNHANASGVDAIVSFDLLVGASDANLVGARADRTVVVASTNAVPTGQMVTHPDLAMPETQALLDRVESVSRSGDNHYLDAGDLAARLLGTTTTANVLLLGAAVQSGALPIPVDAIERAIELNGVAVQTNLRAFRWGRAWVDDPAAVRAAAGIPEPPRAETVDELIVRLRADLVEYQSEEYAARFATVVDRARAAERAAGDSSEPFTSTVARNLHKLMAYKDEYEVARLLLADEGQRGYAAVAADGATPEVTYLLHPPMLRAMGIDRKLRLQRSAVPALRALRRGKRLRGTLADPFRWAEVRRVERAMIPEYIAAVDRLSARLQADPTTATLTAVTEIAALPDAVRGYEDLKLRRAAAYRSELARRL